MEAGMKRGQALLQFPENITEESALQQCIAKGYRVTERQTASAIGFNVLLSRGKILAALVFDTVVDRWTLVEAIR